MSDIKIIEDILKGEIQKKSKGHIVHPLIKLLLILYPLLLASVSLYLRFNEIQINNYFLTINLFTILLCQSLDFRNAKKEITYKWIIILAIILDLAILNKIDLIEITEILSILGIKNIFSYIGSFISTNDLIIIFLFFVAARGVNRLLASDILWISRFFYFPKVKYVYFIVVFTYFIVQNTISRRIATAWTVAVNKSRLVKKNTNNIRGLWVGIRLFIQKLLSDFLELSQLTESILSERGFFEKKAKNQMQMSFSPEDLSSVIILLVVLIFSIQFFGVYVKTA